MTSSFHHCGEVLVRRYTDTPWLETLEAWGQESRLGQDHHVIKNNLILSVDKRVGGGNYCE